MVTVEEKIDLFYKIILKKQREECEFMLDEAQKQNEGKINNYMYKLKQRKKDVIEKGIKSAQLKRDEMVSKAVIEAKREILNKKREVLEKIILELEEQVKAFTNDIKYEEYVFTELKEVFKDSNDNDEELIVYLTRKDLDRFKNKLLSFFSMRNKKVKLLVTEENILGGVFICNKSKTYIIDLTLKAKIEENQNLIGEIVYNELEQVGDIFE